MRTAAALRQEVQGLRQAIEDIKRDLPISEAYEEPLEEELMSFRPAKPAVRELGTETEAQFERREKDSNIERDLELIKDKIDALKTTFQHREETDLHSRPDFPRNSTARPDLPRDSASKARQERLVDELARLQEENKALKEMLGPKGHPADTIRRKSVKTRTKKKGEGHQCENCAFLRSKGFESDLCYRHRMKTMGKSLKKR